MDEHHLDLLLGDNILTAMHKFEISVLAIDDQPIIIEAIKRMLQGENGIAFHHCCDPGSALKIALKVNPTVILLDLVMPEVDGLTLLKYFRANAATKEIPIVVLSTKEDPLIKAQAFALGANDYLVKLPDKLELVARIRYHSNAYIRLLERNEAFEKLFESQRILLGELADAAAYVKSLLPLPMKGEIDIDWRFIPSTQLGGDAFGYHWLDDRRLALYLLDVCGHGVGAALHSVSIVNALRSHHLPKADYYDPKSVLKELNAIFQMDSHNDMFFTIWYGIFDKQERLILYSSAGHPPAILLTGDSVQNAKYRELKTPGIAIGAMEEAVFENAECRVGKFNQLFVFSDGVFEIEKPDKTMMDYHEFARLLMAPPLKNETLLDPILQSMQKIQGKSAFTDDFCLMEAVFH